MRQVRLRPLVVDFAAMSERMESIPSAESLCGERREDPSSRMSGAVSCGIRAILTRGGSLDDGPRQITNMGLNVTHFAAELRALHGRSRVFGQNHGLTTCRATIARHWRDALPSLVESLFHISSKPPIHCEI
jgi:hypothetical protein